MRAVDEAVHDRVGEGGIVQVLMPVLERQLTGQDRCPGSNAIIEEFEQVVAFAGSDGADRKIVDHVQLDLGDGGEALAERAVGVAEAELLEQARGTHVPGGEARTYQAERPARHAWCARAQAR